jgi:hypothetical protein
MKPSATVLGVAGREMKARNGRGKYNQCSMQGYSEMSQ